MRFRFHYSPSLVIYFSVSRTRCTIILLGNLIFETEMLHDDGRGKVFHSIFSILFASFVSLLHSIYPRQPLYLSLLSLLFIYLRSSK